MRKTICIALFLLAAAGLVSLAYGINYEYFTEQELTVFGNRITYGDFGLIDYDIGPIRSNDTFRLRSVFHYNDYLISSAPIFLHPGDAGDWLFRYYFFNAPPLVLPPNASHFRNLAIEQDNYFNAGPSMIARVEIREDSLRIWWRLEGAPLDTSQFTDYPLPDSAVVFFDCPLTLFGIVSTNLILAAAGTVGLEDNLRYVSADPLTGIAPANQPERFALIAEGDIKVLNTPANGRENSGGLGNNQTDPDLTDIVLSGIYVALNESFTFAQQNDPDSGYVCPCIPDNRGTIYLYGSLYQKRRGYVARATNGTTGYDKHYRYDNTLRFWNFGLWNLRENVVEPQVLDFGDVSPGATVSDTIRLFNDYIPTVLDSASVAAPFSCPARYDTNFFRPQFDHHIALAFTAADTGVFTDTFRFLIPYYNVWMSIPLRAHVIQTSAASSFILHPSSLILSSYPNPFNSATQISFDLPHPGKFTLRVFDLLGREVARLADEWKEAGSHRILWNASSLPSGLYFIRLSAPDGIRTVKTYLMK